MVELLAGGASIYALPFEILIASRRRQMCIRDRGTAAAHYVLGGPQCNDNNAFSIGTATTEIYDGRRFRYSTGKSAALPTPPRR